jgi:hypothetical protein
LKAAWHISEIAFDAQVGFSAVLRMPVNSAMFPIPEALSNHGVSTLRGKMKGTNKRMTGSKVTWLMAGRGSGGAWLGTPVCAVLGATEFLEYFGEIVWLEAPPVWLS